MLEHNKDEIKLPLIIYHLKETCKQLNSELVTLEPKEKK